MKKRWGKYLPILLFALFAALSFAVGAEAAITIAAVDPTDAATDISYPAKTLLWKVTSGDGSDVTSQCRFDVKFGASSSSMAQVATNLLDPLYTVTTLSEGTTYYWQISATIGGQTFTGSVWRFTTIAEQPATLTFTAIDPTDNPTHDTEKAVGSDKTLHWEVKNGSVLATGLVYSVRLGKGASDLKTVATNLSTMLYDAKSMEYDMPYYWQIIATDGYYIWEGPIWTFVTMHDPVKGDISGGCSLGFSVGTLLLALPAAFLAAALRRK